MESGAEYLAMVRAIEIGADLQVQLEKHTAMRPMLAILVRAKREAAEAITGLIDCDPTKPVEIALMQMQVRRFDDLVRWCRALLEDMRDAESTISEADREEIEQLIGQTAGEEGT